MGFDMFADPGGLLFDSYYGEILLQLFLLSYGVYVFAAVPRNPSVFEQRLTWNEYSDRHTKRGTFHRRLRMSRVSFDKLLAIIKVDLAVDEAMAGKRGGAIIPELCLYCTLRWLAGGSYLDICDITGISTASLDICDITSISTASFYRVVCVG